PWPRPPHGHDVFGKAGSFLRARCRCHAARGIATRCPATRADRGREWGQTLAGLNGLARELGLRIIVLTTAGRDAITVTQPALPALCLRQLPLPPTGSACGVPSCTTVRKWSRRQRNRGRTYAMQLGRATFHKMWKVGRSTEEGENLDEVRQRGAGATRKACTAATCRS
ncbi:MAG: hypothetical protein ACXVCM_23455, partial [Ktedonobacteraceae bacterium]